MRAARDASPAAAAASSPRSTELRVNGKADLRLSRTPENVDMRCPQCAYPNMPAQTQCERCGAVIRSAEDAERWRQDWDRLPAGEREAFEGQYREERARFERHAEYLKRSRSIHCLVGACGSCGVSLLAYLRATPMPWFLFYFFLAVSGGVVAGFLLNRGNGGSFKGAGLFLAAFLIQFVVLIIHLIAVGAGDVSLGAFLIFAGLPGVAGSMGFGYLFGTHLALDRTDKSY